MNKWTIEALPAARREVKSLPRDLQARFFQIGDILYGCWQTHHRLLGLCEEIAEDPKEGVRQSEKPHERI